MAQNQNGNGGCPMVQNQNGNGGYPMAQRQGGGEVTTLVVRCAVSHKDMIETT